MAVYQDLFDAIDRVRAGTDDPDAWMRGLSGADIEVVANLVTARTPGAIDAVLTKIRAGHPDLFGTPSVPAGVPQISDEQPGGDRGAAADAIRSAETALAQQKSATAQLDLQVITAVLNAHARDVTAGAALDALQRDIEAAVAARTDLDTPAGARGFQRYLIGKLRDIRTVVESAGLDATSKAALAAALASLYAVPATDGSDRAATDQSPPTQPTTVAPAGGDDALLDELLGPDPALAAGPAPAPAPAAGGPAPMIPAVPPFPALGGSPGLGTPPGSGWAPTAPAGLPLPSISGSAPGADAAVVPGGIGAEDDTSADPPGQPSPDDTEASDADAEDAADPGEDQVNTVRLPDGQMVTASSPELAAAITAAVAGKPIAEAFAQQGITIPAPGSPVTDPIDSDRLLAGDVGILTDRHALALGNGTALVNDRIQPVASVTGPDFLGWEHPPVPGPTPPLTSDTPTPTRPAVTAGPS